MIYCWIIPSADQQRRERYLLILDALGKFSLVDVYVLILFVVAFRFHLAVSDNLIMDIYVTPVYGFFSFLIATCISLLLGHAVLYFHRRSMDIDNSSIVRRSKLSILSYGFGATSGESPKRLSCVMQVLLLLTILLTLGLLIFGFVQQSFTFKIGGFAGAALGEDSDVTSYSVLSLGSALSSSVTSPRSLGILFLQGTYFFFTVVTPILSLILLILCLYVPMQLRSQRYFLVAVEITRSWAAIEVFLLSVLAALYQISTFASFMIGDKCDEINILVEKIFNEEGVDAVCFTVEASVESNCWFLLLGAFLNSVLVSLSLNFAENIVKEIVEGSVYEQREQQSSSFFTQQLFKIPCIGKIVFVSIPTNSDRSSET